MAAGTTNRQREKSRAGRRDDVIHLVVFRFLAVNAINVGYRRARGDEAGERYRQGVVTLQHIAGHLVADEGVEGQVGVECADDRVAVGPRAGPLVVGLVAMAFSKARHIQPVASPALPIVGAGKQPGQDLIVRIGGLIGDEGLHLLACRREPDEIEIDPADQSLSIDLSVRGDALGPRLRQHEAVDSGANPLVALNDRRLPLLKLTEGPVGSDIGPVRLGGEPDQAKYAEERSHEHGPLRVSVVQGIQAVLHAVPYCFFIFERRVFQPPKRR